MGRSRYPAVVLVSALALAPLLACGLGIMGIPNDATGGPEGGSTVGDALSDSPVAIDGGADAEQIPDADFEVSVEPFDAGVVDAGCTTVTIDDPLSSIDTAKWQPVSNLKNFPVTEPSGGTRILHLLTSQYTSLVTGYWLKAPVPLTSFDVQFTVYGSCGSHNIFDESCADGMTAAWIDDVAPNNNAILDVGAGSTLGVPKNIGGAALAIDFYQNSDIGDQGTPALELLGLDGTKAPATYAWIKAQQQHTGLDQQTHTIRISNRGGVVNVFYDNTKQFGGGNVTLPNLAHGKFGFTAATGGETATFYIWNFHGVFYDCALAL